MAEHPSKTTSGTTKPALQRTLFVSRADKNCDDSYQRQSGVEIFFGVLGTGLALQVDLNSTLGYLR